MRFINVQATGPELAIEPEVAHLGKVIRKLVGGNINQSKLLHTGSVYHKCFIVQLEHLGKGCGVRAF